MSSDTKTAQKQEQQDISVEEDAFEDFPLQEDWAASADQDENQPLWVQDWDDQETSGPDFQQRLKAELDKSMKE
eukprot:CAMPEP_0202897142 /NCGR_PEP_ID=MMETSP1392-20130828/5985_1 /ASSEMBLY_ACC=CAM_ASM_000868 /TAXON_ID=225041 /ORGANISM="Chlamydomonas chlamydogama, Strain SAG 11-48b" /LENGTH=73 /DNA_ID=CAMNT_0049582711 /DNA_START=174 /DNA_END=395 /DNA_ORIENTATION=-